VQRRQLDDDVADFFGEKATSQSEEEEEEQLFGWSSRTKKMHQTLSNAMKKQKSVQFEKVVEGKARNTAAGVFYQLLVLKSHSVIDVEQPKPYSDIKISKDKNFSVARAH
jgi:cohesin complex subunit SCC1